MSRSIRCRHARLAAVMALLLLGVSRPGSPDDAVNRAVNAGVRSARRSCGAIGVHVVDLSDGRTVYAYNADRQRIVASNTKLFTAATALDRLGPGHFFETEVLLDGRVAGGVLTGDLAIVGVTALGYPDATAASGYRFRLALASVAPVPFRPVAAETILAENSIDENTIAAAAQAAMDGITPISDTRGSARYRKMMVRNLTRQAVTDVWEQIGG